MKHNFTVLLIVVMLCSLAAGQERLRMSTTTSTENSGLLKVLLPPFEHKCNCKVDVIAVGTGKAFRRLAASQTKFVSRGDESGTHQKEKEIWEAAAIKPEGQWYLSSGQGMGETIMMATELRAYTLADRGTYNAFKNGKTDLKVLFEGEKGLFNAYGIIAVNPAKHGHANYKLAMELIEFVTGPEGQGIISSYKVNGEPIFFIYKSAK